MSSLLLQRNLGSCSTSRPARPAGPVHATPCPVFARQAEVCSTSGRVLCEPVRQAWTSAAPRVERQVAKRRGQVARSLDYTATSADDGEWHTEADEAVHAVHGHLGTCHADSSQPARSCKTDWGTVWGLHLHNCCMQLLCAALPALCTVLAVAPQPCTMHRAPQACSHARSPSRYPICSCATSALSPHSIPSHEHRT